MSAQDFKNVLGGFTPSTLGSAARHFGDQVVVMKAQASRTVELAERGLLAEVARPKDQLRVLIGKTGGYPETVGGHPDFDHLRHRQTEQHYIVSVFADIKGSTKLATRLPLEDVRQIKNGALTTMIDIFHAFDGHIHRLQGDGLLAFFGRKDMRQSQAIIDALNAASFLQYYFQNVLQPMFDNRGFPPIRIRVGIDFGAADRVLWSRYGIAYCDEVTTTSMHTDLAAKLQGRAKSNGVMIGDHVRTHLDLPDEFYRRKTVTREGRQVEDRYVLQYEGNTYSMWEFDWARYLGRFLINPARSDTSTYKAGEHFSYTCEYGTDGAWAPYPPNCTPLRKGVELNFILDDIRFRYDGIEWMVINRGQEATNAGGNSLNFTMDDHKNKTRCPQSTAYTGHHYMVCTVRYQGRTVASERIGVYVNDD